jgi:cell wall-associated NlpC family hydrolase
MDKKLIVKQARTWLGTKYHHQGRLKKSANCLGGVDCIGLVIGVANELSICDIQGNLLSLQDRTGYSMNPEKEKLAESFSSHLSLISQEQMQVGDILLFKFWKEPQHIGILSTYPTGGFGIIHCNSSSGSVVEQPLSDTWRRMITHVYRFKQ